MELTEYQINKHKELLREIEDYRGTLDGVSRLGQALVRGNPRAPGLQATVQAQITNLEESYLNLQSTAHQIRAVTHHIDDYKPHVDAYAGYTPSYTPGYTSSY